jgi:hypothetical protein
VARILLVGWDERGPALTRELLERGHLVRATASTEAGAAAIEDAGAEAVTADPGRLGTLLPHLHGVSAIAWLAGDSPRLEPLVETLVDTHVRGLVCDQGPGADAARGVAATSSVGFEAVAEPGAMAPALDRVLQI